MQSVTLEQSKTSPSINPDAWAWFFIAAHLVAWTLTPILVRYNLPLDSIEGSLWGHQLQWGYDKNPFLNGWLTALAIYLGGTSGWMVYLFSQLSVAICLFAVYRLAKAMLQPIYALVALLLLEGVQYFHFHAIDFNDNTLELSLWALTILFFYQALYKANGRNALQWMLTGLFAGLGMMAKYYTGVLLTSMLLLLLAKPEHRRQLTTTGPYYALGIFLLVIAPHCLWLFSHHFITITYVFERASAPPHWTNHLFFPAQFIWQQLEVFLPTLILCIPLLRRDKTNSLPLATQPPLAERDKSFLFFVGLGPLLLTVLLSLILGIKLRAGWGMPLLSLWTIMLVATLHPKLTLFKLQRFVSFVFLLIGLLVALYSYALIYSTTMTSANFPGKTIAQTINRIWDQRYHQPLTYVAGSRWLGGNISLYAKDRPAVFMEWDEIRSPWINTADFEKKGAIFLWDINAHETLPANIKARYPRLSPQQILSISPHRNQPQHLPPVQIGMAILPPASPLSIDSRDWVPILKK